MKITSNDRGFYNFLRHQQKVVNKEPTMEASIIQSNIAVKMLIYVNALTLSNMELIGELNKHNKLKGMVKFHCCKYRDQSFLVYEDIASFFENRDSDQELDEELRDCYDNVSSVFFKKACDAVNLSGIDKWYNISCSLSRLIEKLNTQLTGKFVLQSAPLIYNAEWKFKILGLKSNCIYDNILSTIKTNVKVEI